MRRPFLHSLVLSFLAQFVFLTLAVVFLKDWLSAWFVILMLWPVVWMAIAFWGTRDPNTDFYRNQTYFNIDQTRRNTDKMVK